LLTKEDGSLYEDTDEDTKWTHAWNGRWKLTVLGDGTLTHPGNTIFQSIIANWQDFHEGKQHAKDTMGKDPLYRDVVNTPDGADADEYNLSGAAGSEEVEDDAVFVALLNNSSNAVRSDAIGLMSLKERSRIVAREVLPTSTYWPQHPLHGRVVQSDADQWKTINMDEDDETNDGNDVPTVASTVHLSSGMSVHQLADTWLVLERSDFPAPDLTRSNPTLESHPSLSNLADISTAFQHNIKQYQAFGYAATAFVQSLFALRAVDVDPANSSAVQFPPQLLLHVPGPAGSGKSQVVASLLYLADALHARNTLATSATMGKAALAINGNTVHFLFSLPRTDGGVLAPLSAKQKTALRRNNLFIIDEISMCNHLMLSQIDARLKEAFDNSKPMGGAHVILLGDFLQLPPICKGSPLQFLYEYPLAAGGMHSSTARVNGWEAYRAFTTVVEFTDVIRQPDGPYKEALCRLTNGTLTDADIRLLNTRVVGGSDKVQLPADIEIPTVTVGNDTRYHLAEIALNIWLKQPVVDTTGAPQPAVIPIMLEGNFTMRKGKGMPTPSRHALLIASTDDKFQGRAPILFVAPGLRVVVGTSVYCKNSRGEKVLVLSNGSIGTVYGADFPAGTSFKLINNPDGTPSFYKPSQPISHLLLQVPKGTETFPRFPGLPVGVFPLSRSTCAGKYEKKSLKSAYLKVNNQQYNTQPIFKIEILQYSFQ
jgi:hypothetical protein